MPAPRKAPGDVTGRSSAALTQAHQKELEERAKELTVLNAVTLAANDEVIDLAPRDMSPPAIPETIEVAPKTVETEKIQVVEKIEMMVYGVGNFYDFEPGRTYRVPKDLADHLAVRGYLWGR